jgi:hypothetical protein
MGSRTERKLQLYIAGRVPAPSGALARILTAVGGAGG